MGGRKKQTVGYRYAFGLHLGFARGPIDELVEIRVGDRTAWRGRATGNASLRIAAPDLFGGDEGEGGIDGTLDVLMGGAEQAVHPGLATMLGGRVPAFRGVATAFYNGIIGANNPYPKPWTVRLRRALAGWDGAPWYPNKAIVPLADGAIRAMNPAHILVEGLTNRDWGRGLDRGRLDEASYRAAADTLHAEGFGLCLRWTRQTSISQFLGSILDYIGAAQYVDRRSGLLTLTLIRDDYDVNALPLFDHDSGLLGIDEDDTASSESLVNQVIVQWRNPIDNSDGQVRDQALGSIQATGRVASTTLELPGLPTAALALRIARRELRAAAAGLKRFKVRLDRRGYALAPGGVFQIRDPLRGLGPLVLRVVTFDDGTRQDGTITITALQDVFGLPAASAVAVQPPGWVPPDPTPQVPPARRLLELSYRDLAAALGRADLASVALDAGYIASVAQRPAGLALNYRLMTRVGDAAFAEAALGDWCPTALLAADLGVTATGIALVAGSDLDEVTVGSGAMVGDERVRVVTLDPQAQQLTLARGCADTVPAAHAAGTRIWFYEDAAASDPTEYVDGETVHAQLLTRTSSAQLDPVLAPIDQVVLDQRHARPYPPGDLRLNGQAYPSAVDGDLIVSWAHRDRVLQADQWIDHAQGSIGPEPGTTYVVRVFDHVSAALLETATDVLATRYACTLIGRYRLRIEVASTRDGLSSWQRAQHVLAFRNGVLETEAGDDLVTETEATVLKESP